MRFFPPHSRDIQEVAFAMGVTSQLAEFCASIKLASLPPRVVTRARFLVLDLVGNIVRARHDAESTASFVSAVRAMGMATGNSGVFGDAARYSPAGAAFLNGALAHSLDFDDTHAAGSLHPGAPVIPAALAAGEMMGASGADVLAAIVAGYEVTCRLALALPAGEHYDRGGQSVRPGRRWRGRSHGHGVVAMRRQPAIFSQWGVDETFPGRMGRDQRPDGSHSGARGLQRRLGSAGGQARLHARLRPEPEAGARGARPRHG